MIAFHIPDELLVAYSAGHCDEATALVVATHLTLCPACRALNGRLDAVGGNFLERMDAESVSDAALESVLSKLDAPAPKDAPPKPNAALAKVPRPIVAYLEGIGPAGELPWRRIMPGAEELKLSLKKNGMPVRMTRTRGGFILPKHTHAGSEMTLVLAGGFEDRGEHYEPGDVAICDQSVTHTIHFDPGDPCVALVVNDARLIPKGPFSKVVSLFVDF